MDRDDTHVERAPLQTWTDSAETPPDWDRYARGGGLERWTAEQDEALERDVALTTRRIRSLDVVRPAARAALGAKPSATWRTILGGLVVATWDAARRMSGNREACVGRVERDGRAPFGSVPAALEFAVYRQPLLGVASQATVILRDRPRDVAARMAARAAGIDVRQPRTSTVSSAQPRGVAAVDLRIDVLRALRRARVGAVDLWLVVASDVGELRGRARRTKNGVVEAFCRRTLRELLARLQEHGIDISVAELRERLETTRAALRAALEAAELVPRPPKLRVIYGGLALEVQPIAGRSSQ